MLFRVYTEKNIYITVKRSFDFREAEDLGLTTCIRLSFPVKPRSDHRPILALSHQLAI